MKEYEVILKDVNADVITTGVENTLKAAKSRAKHWLTSQWARECGTTHQKLATYGVEIRDESGDVIWDCFDAQSE